MIKKIILIAAFFSLLSFIFINNFRELVLEKLKGYADEYPEKIYIQTDKPYYTTGNDIWYTVYMVNGINHKRSDISRVVYVELINEQDSIISKKQLYTKDISVAGDFKTKKNWKSGNYFLRAYTNYMRNSNSDYFFQTEIPIWNTTKDSTLNKKSSTITNNTKSKIAAPMTPPEISFYPESGYLVNGIKSKVGIKVKNQDYKNIELKGTIKNSNGDAVGAFSTYKFGLGLVSLLPEANKTYYACINFNGEDIEYPLPKALKNGYNLNIINSGDQIVLQTYSNTPLGLKNTFLLVHQRGRLIFEKPESEDINSSKVKISTSDLNDGIASFTLFDRSGKPVCERLVYIDNPNNDVNVNLSITNETPKTRDKVSMEIQLNDNAGNNISGNLSMSITDIDVVGQSSKSENIKTYLLLNSDLRGRIDDPGYFFEKENDFKRRYLLDILMLTHGWRRFTWDKLLYEKKLNNLKFEPELGIYISGRTADSEGLKKQISAPTRLTFMKPTPYQEKQQSNANGIFKYGPYVFNDSLPIILEARVKDFKSDDIETNRFVSIYLNDPLTDSPIINKQSSDNILQAKNIDSSKINSFLKQAKKISEIDSEFLTSATLLEEVLITAQKKSEQEKRTKEMNERTLYGSTNRRLDLSQNENLRNFSITTLLNRLPNVRVFQDTVYIRNQKLSQILLDDFNVEFADISFMTGEDIDFIDFLNGAGATIFSNSSSGAIAIYSRTGSFSNNSNVKRKPGIIDFTTLGFYTAREFYAPDHMNGFDEAMKPDIRTTLHWEPKITLDKTSNKADIIFFTSDVKSKYAIKIEGITDTGTPIYHLSTFEVD